MQQMTRRVGGFFSEFWKFAAKGNVFDLAVAVILGTSFTTIINALVADIITPLLSLATNHVNLSTYVYMLRGPEFFNGEAMTPVTIGYGHLLQVSMNFLIVAFVVFIMFKFITRIRKRLEHEDEVAPLILVSTQEKLLSEIRDLLREQGRRKREE